MKTYPILKVSNYYSTPELIPPNPSDPSPPKKPVEIISENGCMSFFVYGIAFSLMPIISVTSKSMIGFVISFILFLVIYYFYSVYLSDEKEKNRKFNYENSLKYKKELEYYNERMSRNKEIREAIKIIEKKIEQNPEYLKIIEQEKKVEFCKRATKPSKNEGEKIIKGRSENLFSKHLKIYFRDLLLSDYHIADDDLPVYFPDFIIYEPIFNILIDIEIDEPYTSNECKPIHEKGADDKRDSFFLENNWFVIRFTEKQVVTNPIGCCKFVADFFNKFHEQYDKIQIKEICLPLNRQKQWDKSEALTLAKSSYRNSYLPVELQFNHNLEEPHTSSKKTSRGNSADDDLPF